jgi:hypothetical protein
MNADMTKDDSDAESFHSAVSSVAKARWRRRSGSGMEKPLRSQHYHNTKSVELEKASHDLISMTNDIQERSVSHRPKRNPCPVPRRKSSLPEQQKRSRQNSTTALALLSRQIFSSLDGVLAMSREFTPLPSASTSRTTTRHASLAPDDSDDPERMQRMCRKLDARLAAFEGQMRPESAASQSYRSSVQAESAPNLPSGSRSRSSSEYDYCTFTSVRTSIEQQPQRPRLDTVISWTSNATRRAEYEKIDRANAGVRGFWRKTVPKYIRKKDCRRGFFTGDCDGDSVRRFRMDVNDEDSIDERQSEGAGESEVLDEKITLVGTQSCPVQTDQNAKPKQTAKKKWWSCFSS